MYVVRLFWEYPPSLEIDRDTMIHDQGASAQKASRHLKKLFLIGQSVRGIKQWDNTRGCQVKYSCELSQHLRALTFLRTPYDCQSHL